MTSEKIIDYRETDDFSLTISECRNNGDFIRGWIIELFEKNPDGNFTIYRKLFASKDEAIEQFNHLKKTYALYMSY